MSSIFIGICKPFRGFLARVPLAVAGAILALAGTAGAQQVYFDPSANYPNDYVFTVELNISTGGQAVQGVEARIVYDNFLLHLDAVTPGPWLTGASLPHYLFDYTDVEPQGVIRFASALLGGTSDQDGVLAYCHFTAYDFGTSPLIFQDLDVRDGANTPLGFSHSTGDFITLDPVIPTESSSFGGVKALFR